MLLPDLEQRDSIYLALKQRPPLPLAQQSNFLPLTAKLYERLWRQQSLSILTFGSFSVSRELALMCEWLDVQPEQRVLDAACSSGLYARTLKAHTERLDVVAVDMSLPFLKQAKKMMDAPFTLVLADVAAMPFEDESFDSLVCGGSLNEMLDLEACLAEMARVLKPNGRMWQMYLKPAEGIFGKAIQGLLRLSGIRFIDPEQLNRITQEQGLNLIKAQHRGIVVMAVYEKSTADAH